MTREITMDLDRETGFTGERRERLSLIVADFEERRTAGMHHPVQIRKDRSVCNETVIPPIQC